MPTSLLTQLPRILAQAQQLAAALLKAQSHPACPELHTHEVLLPGAVQQAPHPGQSAQWGGFNRLIQGDNLLAMAALLRGNADTPSLRAQVDLVYIDPPFHSQANYRTRRLLPGLAGTHKPTVIEQLAYADTWPDGGASYLAMLTPRLILLRELLADSGTLYVHVDPAMGHYVKLLLDELFGKDCFQRQIVWRMGWVSGYKSMAKHWIRNHDLLFQYSKRPKGFTFNKQYIPYPPGYVRRDGKAPTGKGYPVEDTWNCSEIDRMDSIQLMSFSKEKRGYATQKNENLLQRIVQASSHPGDWVLDCFAGSGTTAAVAEKLGRRWISTDIGQPACMIMRQRLLGLATQPFVYQTIAQPPLQAAQNRWGPALTPRDLSAAALALVGAQALPPAANPDGNLGQWVGAETTLVRVADPQQCTSLATVQDALAQRDSSALLGGFSHLVLLAWQCAPDLGAHIHALNDPGLDVLTIAPHWLNRLPHKTNPLTELKAGAYTLRGKLCVSSLAYLIAPIVCHTTDHGQTLTVRLQHYALLSPAALDLDASNRSKLQALAQQTPLALIEYWAIDPDYDGQLFRAAWYDYRGNTAHHADKLQVVTQALLHLPAKVGTRQVCVRAIDLLGTEVELVCSVAG